MQAVSSDKENTDIDPAKLSLKERIRFFASKNKGAGASVASAPAPPVIAPAPAAGVGAAAHTIIAVSIETSMGAPIADANVGALDAARPIAVAITTPSDRPSDPSAGGAAAVAAVTHAPTIESRPFSSSSTPAPSSMVARGAAVALDAPPTTAGAGAEVRAGAVRATIAPKGARKIVTVRSGARAIGARLCAATLGSLARVEAVDPDGVAAAAGVCVGDVLVKAPFDVREDVEKSFAVWREKADSWVLEFDAAK